MTYKLKLTTAAQLEEDEAYNYYEEIQTGLGDDLLLSLEKCYLKLTENPFYYSFISYSKSLRDIKISRFPYVVVYLIFEDTITIISIRSTYQKGII